MDMHNSHSGNILWDHDKRFTQTSDQQTVKPLAKTTLGNADADGLMTLFMNNPATRQLARNIVRFKANAVLGALAYKAHENWQSNKPLTNITPINAHDVMQASPIPAFTPDLANSNEGLLLVALMKATTAVSGIAEDSATRHDQLLNAAKQLGFDSLDIEQLSELMQREIPASEIASCVNLDKERAEVYLAAYTTSSGSSLQQEFLVELASALGLPEGLSTYLERQADLGIAS